MMFDVDPYVRRFQVLARVELLVVVSRGDG